MAPTSYSFNSRHRQRLILRRNNHNSNTNRNAGILSSSPKRATMWIGMTMCCMAFAYIMVVVIVTRVHISTIPKDTGMSKNSNGVGNLNIGSNINDNRNNNKIVPVPKINSDVNKQEQVPPPPPTPKIVAIKDKRGNDKLTLGVDPDVLVPPREHDAPIAIKKDPPPHEHPTPDYVLSAYLEPIDFTEWDMQPLPIRSTAKAEKLQKVSYPRLNSCTKLMQQFPVDDTPANKDPFLPWIHDVFPTADGKFIQFVAQNKRRCKTGRNEVDILMFMQPQVTLFQHVPVKRVADDGSSAASKNSHRYKLVPHEQADADGMTARFICRFKPSMEETLSVFNFDYEWTSYRKKYKNTFEKDDGGIKSIHTTQLIFKCPVPESLQETIRTGASVKDDWASLFLDLVPIRTPPRYGPPTRFLPPWYKDFEDKDPALRFDALKEYGENHILPQIEDSGRWENIPICKPSLMTFENQQVSDLPAPASSTQPQKKHHLVSCLWASAGYTTRGDRFAINDGQRRLLEWINYNKLIGFDHFYLYDNTGAFRNDTSLKPIADLFPDDVTYIPWPSQVCNNRQNNVDSPGERSSQYAAESSCRLRFGPHVNWIGQFDLDEYLVPMGNHTNVLTLIEELEQEDTRIVAFGSWRAWPRRALIEPIVPIHDGKICWHPQPCFHLKIPLNTTMLQAYNCDRQPPGQKQEVMPAEKQLYRADYVTQHFVHYSAATTLSEKNMSGWKEEGLEWRSRAFPDPRQRFANELTEGLMIHTKAVAHQDTAGYEKVCHINNTYLPKKYQGLCRLGMPWPNPEELAKRNQDPAAVYQNATPEGYYYNCYVNEKVEYDLVPRLEQALAKFANFFDNNNAPQ